MGLAYSMYAFPRFQTAPIVISEQGHAGPFRCWFPALFTSVLPYKRHLMRVGEDAAFIDDVKTEEVPSKIQDFC
jgi:hypothetical protein